MLCSSHHHCELKYCIEKRKNKKMGKNKKGDERKGKGEIKIVDPSTREYTFVQDTFTLPGFNNNITSRDSEYNDKSKDTRKLGDIRKKKKNRSIKWFSIQVKRKKDTLKTKSFPCLRIIISLS